MDVPDSPYSIFWIKRGSTATRSANSSRVNLIRARYLATFRPNFFRSEAVIFSITWPSCDAAKF